MGFQSGVDGVRRGREIYTKFLANVPPEEQSPVGLGVIAVATLTGTFTFPHRPFFRSLIVVPSLAIGSTAFAYPVTSKHILRTGLAHSGGPMSVEELSGRLPTTEELPGLVAGLPGAIANLPDKLSGLPSLDQVIEKVTSTFNTEQKV